MPALRKLCCTCRRWAPELGQALGYCMAPPYAARYHADGSLVRASYTRAGESYACHTPREGLRHGG